MIATVCLIGFGWAVPLLGECYYGQPSAALWKDQLLVAITVPMNDRLYRGTFRPMLRQVHSPIEHLHPLHGDWNIGNYVRQAKIDIRNDRILLSCVNDDHYIFRMEDVPLLEASEFGNKLREVRDPPVAEANPLLANDPDRILLNKIARLSRFVNPHGGEWWDLVAPKHRAPDVPLSDGDRDVGDRPSAQTYVATVRHDVLIAGPKSVRLFHAYKEKFFVSVEPDYLRNWYLDDKFNIAKNLPKPPDRELRTGKLPADFTERFAAYTADKRDYLVTPNGKIYMSVPKGKAEVEVSAVWTDPKRKIVGVVQDSANDAVYGWGFVTDSAAPERFYVMLDPKPVAVAYKRTVPLWGDRSDAYLESYECARAFRKK